jgi:Domain of unknown function (DUF4412)
MRMIIAAARVATPLALSALCALPAAAQFEGTVTWKMEKGQMAQTYKGMMVRTEMTGEGGRQGVMIMDHTARTMTMLMPEDKMYMVMNLKDMSDREDRKPPKLTDMGKTETIAGKTCHVYRYAKEAGEPETTELCAAKGMGYFLGGGRGPMGMGRRGQGPDIAAIAANPEYAKLYKDGFFPLRISKLEDGKVKNEMIVTQIEAKSVEASAFTTPPDYTEMKMPGGMARPPRPQNR